MGLVIEGGPVVGHTQIQKKNGNPVWKLRICLKRVLIVLNYKEVSIPFVTTSTGNFCPLYILLETPEDHQEVITVAVG